MNNMGSECFCSLESGNNFHLYPAEFLEQLRLRITVSIRLQLILIIAEHGSPEIADTIKIKLQGQSPHGKELLNISCFSFKVVRFLEHEFAAGFDSLNQKKGERQDKGLLTVMHIMIHI